MYASEINQAIPNTHDIIPFWSWLGSINFIGHVYNRDAEQKV